MHAVHSKEETLTEQQDLFTKIQKQIENNKVKKEELKQKCRNIEKVISQKKEYSKNRDKSENLVKKRADRLRQNIAKLKEREAKF